MTADPVMETVTAAVELGRAGDVEGARRRLTEVWERVGVVGDALHRCTIAHYLADLQDDPARALIWDIRALDAARCVTDERAQSHHAAMHVASFYPSLHLNLADNFRRLGSFAAAEEHLAAAQDSLATLADDAYGALIRDAMGRVASATADRDTAALSSE